MSSPPDWMEVVCGLAAEGPHPAVEPLLDRHPARKKKDGSVVQGALVDSLRNVELVLRHDPRFSERARLNLFDGRVFLDGELLRDTHGTALAVEIDRLYGLRPTARRVEEALHLIAEHHAFHPVRDYLQGVEWDGRPRAEHLLPGYLGAEDSSLHRAYGLRFLISAVARVMLPGCKVDTTLVLVGGQGAGKSTAFSVLAGEGEWFCDSTLTFGNKDAYENLRGVWIYELAELDSMRRSESSAIKAFLSAQVDRFRPAYGRNAVEFERQCVFVGTTNEAEFLADPTGSRRFWPVAVGQIDLHALRRDRDQLWAEAMARYDDGESWWLSPEEERARVQASEVYRQVDAWELHVERWTRSRTKPFTVDEVLKNALEKETGQLNRGDSMRVAGILSKLGFTKQRRRLDGERANYWARWAELPEEAP